MLTVKVPLAKAQEVKQFLLKHRLFSEEYKAAKDSRSIYFPIRSKANIEDEFDFISFSDKDLEYRNTGETLRKALDNKLTEDEKEALKTAFDTLGNIAILEVDPELEKKEKLIAETLLKSHKNIKTVVKKVGTHSGEFRLQKVNVIAGENTKEALYKENGIMLKFDVEKVYFSPRLSTERKRIMGLVKKGEEVLVMFSGCAPYPCVISRNTMARRIVGVEINPDGHSYGLENIRLNKLKNIELFQGDVNKVVPDLGKFDRILMPLPKSAENFLDTAISAAKDKAIIHFYAFLNEEEFDKAKGWIKEACKKAGKKCRILRTVRCGQHAPRVFRICVDFSVSA